jgi:serine protease Do
MNSRRCSAFTLCLVACGLVLSAPHARAADAPGRRSAIQASADITAPPRTIADLKALEARIQKTSATVMPSVVAISGGSGVVISRDGYILTVAHVGQRAGRTVMVVFPDGRQARAVTLGNDHGLDAGMARIIDPGPWPYAETATSSGLKPGNWCLTLGYPVTFERGKPPLVRAGRVLRNGKTQVITDCTIMGGDSGAPLFDLDGKVVAIGTQCDTTLIYNIHVPMDGFSRVWDQLVGSEDFDSLAPQALLGVTGAEGARDGRIATVVPGSAAEKAGLRPGDVVLRFGDKEIRKYDELPPLVRKQKPGDKVEVAVRRGTEELKLDVTLGQTEPSEE